MAILLRGALVPYPKHFCFCLFLFWFVAKSMESFFRGFLYFQLEPYPEVPVTFVPEPEPEPELK